MKTFLVCLLVIALVALAVALGYFSQGFKNWNVNDWITETENLKGLVTNCLRR